MTRSRAASLGGAIVLSVALLATVPAQAAKPKCFGKTATIVGTKSGGTLNGTKKADVIVGKAGNDVINGKGGNDLICSGPGDDTISGAGGSNKINGGDGTDLAGYKTAKAAIDADLTTGEASVGNATDELSGVENLEGSAFGDTLVGNDGPNELFGLAGDDALDGGLGTDSLNGGDGTDTCLQGEDILSCEDLGSEDFTFPNARLQVTLVNPLNVPMVLNGEVVMRVFSAVQDADGDGLEELVVELVSADFEGTSALGTAVITHRSVDKHPNLASVGTIEESANSVPGEVEVPDFGTGPGGIATLDTFFEAAVAGYVLHNHDPVVIQGAVTQWPPPAGASLLGLSATINTFNEDETTAPTALANVVMTLVP